MITLALKRLSTLVTLLSIFIVYMFINTIPVSALSGLEFNNKNIMSDAVFFNGIDMSETAIQEFLVSKVPICDTMGVQLYGGVTRRVYSETRGIAMPLVCLKDYVEATPAVQAETGLCTGLGAGTKTAARIIYEVGLSCGVSQKVLLVLLQKEQALVTDDWPWPIQYRSATGYGCPDTAACDTTYYGFFNQLYNAARQFKRYSRNPSYYNHRALYTSDVQYNPSTSCSSTPVLIENQATAGLYNYTPYQPNQAALSNLYGTGDGCSAYGNRNFWRLYSEWFGSTQLPATCTNNEPLLPFVRRFYNPKTFQHFYSAYDCDVAFLKKLGYVNEGAAFNTTAADKEWAVPVYRYYNPSTRQHMWATQLETPEQLSAGGTGYQQEAGIVFYVVNSNMPGIHPIQQFYNKKTYLHLWAANPSPQDILNLRNLAGYEAEAISFYAQ